MKNHYDYWNNATKKSETKKSFLIKLFSGVLMFSTLGIFIFRESLLLSYGKWISGNISEFNSSADVLVFMDVVCPRVDSAAQRVANGEAKVLYMFPYDDVDYNLCKQDFDNAVQKYKLEKRSYWGPVSDTSLGAAKTFKERMTRENVPHKKILLTSVKFGIRRTHWSLRHVLGADVAINAYGASDDAQMDDPEWWNYTPSRVWVLIETKKLVGYWVYYGVLNQDHTINIREKDLM